MSEVKDAKKQFDDEVKANKAHRDAGAKHDCRAAGCTVKPDGTDWPVDEETGEVKYD